MPGVIFRNYLIWFVILAKNYVENPALDLTGISSNIFGCNIKVQGYA
jgi:hypothetical protein